MCYFPVVPDRRLHLPNNRLEAPHEIGEQTPPTRGTSSAIVSDLNQEIFKGCWIGRSRSQRPQRRRRHQVGKKEERNFLFLLLDELIKIRRFLQMKLREFCSCTRSLIRSTFAQGIFIRRRRTSIQTVEAKNASSQTESMSDQYGFSNSPFNAFIHPFSTGPTTKYQLVGSQTKSTVKIYQRV